MPTVLSSFKNQPETTINLICERGRFKKYIGKDRGETDRASQAKGIHQSWRFCVWFRDSQGAVLEDWKGEDQRDHQKPLSLIVYSQNDTWRILLYSSKRACEEVSFNSVLIPDWGDWYPGSVYTHGSQSVNVCVKAWVSIILESTVLRCAATMWIPDLAPMSNLFGNNFFSSTPYELEYFIACQRSGWTI